MHRLTALLGVLVVLAVPPAAVAERIKDITDIQGVRSNPLQGMGLVVGLSGTGDGAAVATRVLANLLRRFEGLNVVPGDLVGDNVAVVMVRAELPPFARRGQKIDVDVSAIGDAESLQGGTLLMTPLRGADGEVYAVANGPLIIGGFSASGERSAISQNHTTVGRIPRGAHVEREEIATFVEDGTVMFNLRNPDFSTAEAVRAAVHAVFADAAETLDAGTIRVRVPPTLARGQIASFLDRIGQLAVQVDMPAVVVLNERTGTIVVGENVGVSTVAISHGNLSIITQEKEAYSQPLPFSRTGTTERIRQTDITAVEEEGPLHVVERKASVQELARALNAMGLTPRDLISIFQALRQAGALQAELKAI